MALNSIPSVAATFGGGKYPGHDFPEEGFFVHRVTHIPVKCLYMRCVA
jgi:hypothetical protein